MEIICKNSLTNLFQLVTVIDVSTQVEKAIIHKGYNATYEILLKNDDHYIELDFTGDMERQIFSDQFIDVIDGNVEDDEVDDQDDGSDDSDEDKKKANSDDEELTFYNYD